MKYFSPYITHLYLFFQQNPRENFVLRYKDNSFLLPDCFYIYWTVVLLIFLICIYIACWSILLVPKRLWSFFYILYYLYYIIYITPLEYFRIYLVQISVEEIKVNYDKSFMFYNRNSQLCALFTCTLLYSYYVITIAMIEKIHLKLCLLYAIFYI